MQHAKEALRMVQIRDHRGFRDLEADIAGIRTRVIETLDHEFQKFGIPQGLAGNVDRDAAARRQLQAAAPERGQHRLHHPSVDVRHQAIALGGPNEFRRRRGRLPVLDQAHENLERRPAHSARACMHDGLVIQLELVVAQCALQFQQPLNLAAVARVRLLARRIDVHVQAALLLRHVAGRIRRVHDVFNGAAVAPDFHQADADAHIENLVLPDEAIVVDRTYDVVGYLSRLLQRATDEQQRELVAADAPYRIRIAHRIFDERCDLAQHIVAGGVAAGIVDDFEMIQVEIAQRVPGIAGLRGIQSLLQPPLELAPVDESGKGIVAGLIGHLPSQAAKFAGVVQHQHQSGRVLAIGLQRRHADLDVSLAAAVRRHQHRAPRARHAARAAHGFLYRIVELSAVAFIDQGRHVRKGLAQDLIHLLAEE